MSTRVIRIGLCPVPAGQHHRDQRSPGVKRENSPPMGTNPLGMAGGRPGQAKLGEGGLPPQLAPAGGRKLQVSHLAHTRNCDQLDTQYVKEGNVLPDPAKSYPQRGAFAAMGTLKGAFRHVEP